MKNITDLFTRIVLLFLLSPKFDRIITSSLNKWKKYSNKVRVGYKNTIDWLLMKVLNSFEFLEFKIVLISFEKSHWFVSTTRNKKTLPVINWPYNRLVSFKYLKLLEIIVILGPYSDSVIVAATYESTVIDPFDKFNIVSMPLEDILAFILICGRIESPDPDIFISTAWSYFFISLMPIYAFYLNN